MNGAESEDRPRSRRRLDRLAFRLVGWGCVLWILWMLFTGEWGGLIAIWGAGMAAATAVAAEAIALQDLQRVRGRLGWVRELGPAATAVVVDFGVVTAALVRAVAAGRHQIGCFREDRSVEGLDELAAGRRAWVTLVATWSSNAYVIDIDAGDGRCLLHDLVPRRSSEQPA